MRALLTDYGQFLANSPIGSTGVCLIGYEAELRTLPGNYADFLLARVNGASAGCVALARKVLTDGTDAVEMKRLWVHPGFRGFGVGRGLVEAAIKRTRVLGCDSVVLDTVHDAMPEASRLYQSLGFVEISRFNDNPVPGVRFYQRKLR